MNAEQMMDQLRRIVKAQMENWQRARAVSATGGKGNPRGTYALGQCAAYSNFIEELAQTFGIDPWACVEEEK